MQFILVRHGECVHNIQKDRYIPTALCSLTAKGQQQSIVAAENIKKIVVSYSKIPKISLYYSPYERTKFMANEIIKQIKCDKIFEEPLISEIQCGNFFSEEQYAKEFPLDYECLKQSKTTKTRFWCRFNGGESPFDVYVRARMFLSEQTMDENRLVIIVSHQMTLRVISMILLKKTTDYFEEGKRFQNGEVVLIENGILKAEMR